MADNLHNLGIIFRNMDAECFTILSKDGLELRVQKWSPDSPASMLCMVHGLGEHGGRYEHMAHHLVRHDIAVFAIDMRGHGLSMGQRGHAPSYRHLLCDIEELLKLARSQHTEIPMYLFGHGMGGNLVAGYMMHMTTNELSGYVLSSPWFRPVANPPRWQLRMGKIINRIFPRCTLFNQLNPKNHSRNSAEEAKKQRSDTLSHHKMTVGLYFQMMKNAEQILSSAKKISKPAFVYQGENNEVFASEGLAAYSYKHEKVHYRIMEGIHDEPHSDDKQEEVFQSISAWIQAAEMVYGNIL